MTIILSPTTTDLVICDLDGVLFDSRGRDHLQPAVEHMGSNEAWLPHQDPEVVKHDPILWHNVKLAGYILWGNQAKQELLFLTSRLTVNKDVTLRALTSNGIVGDPGIFIPWHYVDRPMDDERKPWHFKAAKVQAIIAANRNLKRIIFIEDNTKNVDTVMELCHGVAGVTITPVILRP